ncbi:hypothetical protein KAR91_48720 [Candidatus Pacearchaeota archaeon]|nr:hypothetical protein [Candidatus Pacearchaeota archaeon]
MKDLLLDTITHDLVIRDFDLVMLEDGIDRVVQDLKVRLWFFLGEWFLDISKGVPYFDDILVKNPDLNAIEAIFKEVIFNTADVLEILSFDMDYNSSARTLSVEFEVNTTFGTTGTLNIEEQ